jgi:beta-D-galactosyl-(1->4)-L-rhamnose phosphorylase
MHDLIHINEALAGLPVDVKFINFDDVIDGALDDVDILINAGRAGDAWSGGDNWEDDRVISLIFRWAGEGGILIGVNEPSALNGYKNFLRLAPVLGIDIDRGSKVCHGRWQFTVETVDGLIPEGAGVKGKDHVFITDGKAHILAEEGGLPTISIHDFGKGKGIYLSSFQVNNENTRLLLNLMLYAKGDLGKALYLTDNADTECAYYPNAKRLVVMNETDRDAETSIKTSDGDIHVALKPFETQIHELS